MADAKVTVSATEFRHYRRLADFLRAVEDYARLTVDDDLAEMVEATYADLRAYQANPDDGSSPTEGTHDD